jgi:hypothetical protein
MFLLNAGRCDKKTRQGLYDCGHGHYHYLIVRTRTSIRIQTPPVPVLTARRFHRVAQSAIAPRPSSTVCCDSTRRRRNAERPFRYHHHRCGSTRTCTGQSNGADCCIVRATVCVAANNYGSIEPLDQYLGGGLCCAVVECSGEVVR